MRNTGHLTDGSLLRDLMFTGHTTGGVSNARGRMGMHRLTWW